MEPWSNVSCPLLSHPLTNDMRPCESLPSNSYLHITTHNQLSCRMRKLVEILISFIVHHFTGLLELQNMHYFYDGPITDSLGVYTWRNRRHFTPGGTFPWLDKNTLCQALCTTACATQKPKYFWHFAPGTLIKIRLAQFLVISPFDE